MRANGSEIPHGKCVSSHQNVTTPFCASAASAAVVIVLLLTFQHNGADILDRHRMNFFGFNQKLFILQRIRAGFTIIRQR